MVNYIHNNNLHPRVVTSCSIEIEAQIIIRVIFTLMRKVFIVVIFVNDRFVRKFYTYKEIFVIYRVKS